MALVFFLICATLLLSNYWHLESNSIRVSNRLLKNPVYDLVSFCVNVDVILAARLFVSSVRGA